MSVLKERSEKRGKRVWRDEEENLCTRREQVGGKKHKGKLMTRNVSARKKRK